MQHQRASDEAILRAGYGCADITPELGCHLAGVISRRGRLCTRHRDPLSARALRLATAPAEAFIVSTDLLTIPRALFEAVAARAHVAEAQLLLAATHTHSAPGNYWDVGRGELFMGPYRQAVFDALVEQIALAIDRARDDSSPAHASASSANVPGASANRRRQHGPVDPELGLVRFEVDGKTPIDVVCFGAHPVIGCEREPETCSADFPGELCARLERRGHRPLFFTGAVGGLSPLFPEFPLDMDRHLELMGDLLERGVERAEQGLVALEPAPVEARAIAVPLPAPSCSVFPQRGLLWRAADAAVLPLRRWMVGMAAGARDAEEGLLGLVRLGDVAWLGTPCDLGVNVGLDLKAVLRRAGVRFPAVGSHCDGYVGYVHMPGDYPLVPEPGFRNLAFYENAMSLSGFDLGAHFVAALEQQLRASASPKEAS